MLTGYRGEQTLALSGLTDYLVYAAASASESSYGREYLARWEQNEITKTSVNTIHGFKMPFIRSFFGPGSLTDRSLLLSVAT